MSKRRKEVARLATIIAFFVMHATINALLCLDGSIVNGVVSGQALDGSITSVCGMLSLEMGVFGGIIVGLGVSYLHNRFYQIQLPNVISFYEGERFVPIVCAVTYVFVGVLMYFVWPPLQQGVYNLGRLISNSGYFGTFIYGIIKRSLVPFWLASCLVYAILSECIRRCTNGKWFNGIWCTEYFSLRNYPIQM